jgi:hypothetical protein
MSFELFTGVGLVHLNLAKPAKQVPAGERHKWSGPALRGGPPVHCLKCGCRKAQTRSYEVRYVAPGGHLQTELRPPCTGKSSPQTATATPII